MTEQIAKIIDELNNNQAEYSYYGLRYHRGPTPKIGAEVPSSYVWIDGEQTKEKLNGCCALSIDIDSDPDNLISWIQPYCWGKGRLIIIAADDQSWGEDAGEVILGGQSTAVFRIY